MIEKRLEVRLKSGLQARPAALFVQEANRFEADVFIISEDKKVNAKSIMGLMSLAVGFGEMITIVADGEDEQAAVKTLEMFVSKE